MNEEGERRVVLTDQAYLRLVNTGGRASISVKPLRPDKRAGHRGHVGLQLASDDYAPRIMLYVRDTYAGAQIRDSNGKVEFMKESARIENGRDRHAEAYIGDKE